MRTNLSEMLGIDHSVIVAPMFLVSNVEMTVAAAEGGATGAIPALNYRTDKELRAAIAEIKSRTDKPFGINLIVNKSNPKYKKQLDTLVEVGVDYIITSLGSPEETIRRCKPKGIKVFCDVVDEAYAKKVEDLGADAVIAVDNSAGGHCGPLEKADLIKRLLENCSLPVISAGGVAKAEHYQEALAMGASGVSVGTVFLASEEADLSKEYQDALIDYGAEDVVLTTKLSGSHLTVINTPYVQKIGTEASFFESLLLKNKTLKKYVKMFVAFKGMKKIENSMSKASYKSMWCAGPAIEHVHSVRPLEEILGDILPKEE
ncbi:MAG: nitronate monooxygenase [Bacteroidota bacterium]